MKKAEQLEAMRDASMAQRMQSMPSQQVASADNSVPGASPALRPSYVGTPPGYDWRTATDPGPAAQPPVQQAANVPLPPERPPETYTPRAPLQPAAATPPIASIDPNSSNAGAIQFAASGMGRGGMPAAPQTRMAAAPQAAPVAAQSAQPAGTQVAQAPTQTATDAAPAAQAQVVVQQAERVAQAGANIPDPAQARSAGNQSTLAQEHYKQFLRLNKWASHPYMPKPAADAYAKRAEFHKDMAKEYLKPSDKAKLVGEAVQGWVQANPNATPAQIAAKRAEWLQESVSPRTEAQRNAAVITDPNTPQAQAEQLRDMVHTNNPPAMRLAQEEMRARGITRDSEKWKEEYPKALDKYTKTSTNSVSVGGGTDEQIFTTLKDSHKEAVPAARGLLSIQEARKAVQGGGIFGFGADKRLALQKLASLVGVDDAGKIVNTESFFAAIAPVVGATLRQTSGTSQLSEGELKFANRAAAGDTTLDEKSILRVLDILEKINKGSLEEHQRKVDAVYPDPEKYRRERALFGVKMPTSAPAEPSKPAPAAPPAGNVAKPANKQEFDNLPSGAIFIDPQGNRRVKP
jgi:hypothetical protein